MISTKKKEVISVSNSDLLQKYASFIKKKDVEEKKQHKLEIYKVFSEEGKKIVQKRKKQKGTSRYVPEFW